MNHEVALIQVSDLDRLFALDSQISSANLPAVVEQTVGLWRAVHGNGDLLEIVKWGLIYSLKMTVVTDGHHASKAKWQVTQLRDRPFARTWVEFCAEHLDMSPSEASNKKRNWEIYHIELGYPLVDLLIAGVQRLNVARATLNDCLKSVPQIFPEKLLVGVFGRPHVCLACRADVPFADRVPLTCPACEQGYQYQEPLTVFAVKDLIDELKDHPDTAPHVEADIEESDDLFTVLPYFVDSGGERYTLPAWDVPILADGQASTLGGIPAEVVGEFAKWVKARFKAVGE